MYSQYKGGGQGSERWLARRAAKGRGETPLGARARSGNIPKPQMQGGPDQGPARPMPSKPFIQPPPTIPRDVAGGAASMGVMPGVTPSKPFIQPPPRIPGAADGMYGGKGGKGGAPQDFQAIPGAGRFNMPGAMPGRPSYADHLRGQGGYSF